MRSKLLTWCVCIAVSLLLLMLLVTEHVAAQSATLTTDVAVLDSAWTTRYYAAAADSNDNVYVTGAFYGTIDSAGITPVGNRDAVVVRYSAASPVTPAWIHQSSQPLEDWAFHLAVDNTGGAVYYAGMALDASTSWDVSVNKINSATGVQDATWGSTKTVAGSGGDAAGGIMLTSTHVFVSAEVNSNSGITSGTHSGGLDAAVFKFSKSDGALVGGAFISGNTVGTDRGRGMATSPDEQHLFVTGSRNDGVVFLAKLATADLSEVWRVDLPAGSADSHGRAIALSSTGNSAFIVGWSKSTDVTGADGTETGSDDVLLCRVNAVNGATAPTVSDMTCRVVDDPGSTNNMRGTGVALDNDGEVLQVIGTGSSSVLGASPMATGLETPFTARFLASDLSYVSGSVERFDLTTNHVSAYGMALTSSNLVMVGWASPSATIEGTVMPASRDMTAYMLVASVTEPCASSPSCLNGGTCSARGWYDWQCMCATGYDGADCSNNIDDCASNPCANGGTCTDGVDSFSCVCTNEWTGFTCETADDDCAGTPCLNGGTCTDTGLESHECTCVAGYDGADCSNNIDDCASNPCANGGTCTDGVDSFSCTCVAGYDGADCSNNIDDCASNPCANGGTCTDGVDSFSCSCTDQWAGTTCETAYDCTTTPCSNGGTCTDTGLGVFECTCVAGYGGADCSQNIDDCAPNPCQNGGTCTDGVDSFSCACAVGFDGAECSNNIDDCASNPCQNGGSCIDGVDSFSCSCTDWWTGAHCELDVNECTSLSAPCVNGGACINYAGGFECRCVLGWVGDTCQSPGHSELFGTSAQESGENDRIRAVPGGGGDVVMFQWVLQRIQRVASDGVAVWTYLIASNQQGYGTAQYFDVDEAGNAFAGGYFSDSSGGWLLKLNSSQGSVLFQVTTSASRRPIALRYHDGLLLVSSLEGVSAYDSVTCAILWHKAIPDDYPYIQIHSFAIVETRVYCAGVRMGFGDSVALYEFDTASLSEPAQLFFGGGVGSGSAIDVAVSGDVLVMVGRCNDCATWLSGYRPQRGTSDSFYALFNVASGELLSGQYFGTDDDYSAHRLSVAPIGVGVGQAMISMTVSHTVYESDRIQLPCGGSMVDSSERRYGALLTIDLATGECVDAHFIYDIAYLANLDVDQQSQTWAIVGSTVFPIYGSNPSHGGEDVYRIISQPCDHSPCDAGEVCLVVGWDQWHCQVDQCAQAPCANGGTCSNVAGGFVCTCAAGYDGVDCSNNIDDCASLPCQNGATCIDGINSYTCNCVAGYDGTNCENDIDDCSPNPCQNGGSCTDDVNSHTCSCAAGFSGTNCETNNDDCSPNPCQNGGSCTDGVDSYTCSCTAGYDGTNCENNMDECASSPCANGGTCVDGVNDYTCTCPSGWQGKNCDVDTDECATQAPCQNGATCVDTEGSYQCQCASGFEGTNCETEIDECASSPCQNGASCTDEVGDYSCAPCPAGYSGKNCETNVNDCSPNPCANGGSCTDGVDSFSCTCLNQWTGITCETNDDDCAGTQCLNGGTCTDTGLGSFSCSCTLEWTGSTCESAVPDSYLFGTASSDASDRERVKVLASGDSVLLHNLVGTGTVIRRVSGTDGAVLWSRTLPSNLYWQIGLEMSSVVEADNAGGVYLVGSFSGTMELDADTVQSAGGYDAVVIKFDDNTGDVLFMKSFGTTQHDYLTGAFLRGSTVYVTGNTLGTFPENTALGSQDAFVAAVSVVTGTMMWAKQFGGSSSDQAISCFATDSHVYVSGYSYQSNNIEVLVARIQLASGHAIDWQVTLGGSSTDYGTRIVVTGGRVVVAGLTLDYSDWIAGSDGSGVYDLFYAFLDVSDGRLLSGRMVGSTQYEYYVSLAITTSGRVLFGGSVYGVTTLPDPVASVTPANVWSGVLLTLDPDEQSCVRSDILTESGYQVYLRGMSVNAHSGVVAVTGFTDAPTLLGSNANAGSNDVFLLTVQPCSGVTCADSGVCHVSGFGTHECDATDACAAAPCSHGGTCMDTVDGYECDCSGTGFEGATCTVNVDECIGGGPCQNGGTCSDSIGLFTCACTNEWTGTTCETVDDDCADSPCLNGGTCSDTGVGSHECACVPGYDGMNCENNINDCSPSPCQNGGSCTDGVNSYACSCPDGFDGSNCENNIDECASSPCANGGTCVDGVNDYSCTCPTGWQGKNCDVDTDECATQAPCQNGATCVDTEGSYQCQCASGFEGTNCETEIDECASSPCQNGASCTDEVGDYSCAPCPAGYSGKNCETNVNDCSPNLCQNGGSCTDGVDSYTCSCAAGFSGANCETNIDDCSLNPCQNGGSCTDGVDSYTCSCAAGFSGANCETDIDDCSPNPCQNGGTCVDTGASSYQCACSNGFGGTDCANAAPNAVDDVVTVYDDGGEYNIDVLANDHDDDIGADTLSVAMVSSVSAGAHIAYIHPNQGTIHFITAVGETGQVTFTYVITDGTSQSAPATVTVTIEHRAGANQAPTPAVDAAQVLSGQPSFIDVLDNDSDADGDALTTLKIVTGPTHGSAKVVLQYTPDSGFVGDESAITYEVCDAQGACAQSTVSVQSLNNAPVAHADVAIVAAGATQVVVPVLWNDVDEDGHLPLTIESVTPQAGVSRGTLTVTDAASTVTFVPNVGYYGPYSFKYRVADALGALSNPPGVVRMWIPKITDFVEPDTTPGDDVAVAAVFDAANARVLVCGHSDGDFVSSPQGGMDAWLAEYSVETGTRTGTVLNVRQTAGEDMCVDLVRTSTANADELLVVGASAGSMFVQRVNAATWSTAGAPVLVVGGDSNDVPARGVLSSDGTKLYVFGSSDGDFAGVGRHAGGLDAVWSAVDLVGNTVDNTKLQLGGAGDDELVDAVRVVGDVVVAVGHSTSEALQGVSRDNTNAYQQPFLVQVDGSAQTLAWSTPVWISMSNNGTAGAVAASPDGQQVAVCGRTEGDVNGETFHDGASDAFVSVYAVSAGGFTHSETVLIDRSVGAAESCNALAWGADDRLYVGVEVDDDVYVYRVPADDLHSTDVEVVQQWTGENPEFVTGLIVDGHDAVSLGIQVSSSGATQSVAHAKGYHGDSMHTASGGGSGSDVVVGKVFVNTVPVATDDTYATIVGALLSNANVLGNDVDADGDPLEIVATGAATQGGTVTVAGPKLSVSYQPPSATWVGTDTFTYEIQDPSGASSVAIVTVQVTNQAPTAGADAATVVAGDSVTIAVKTNDNDADGHTITVTGVADPANGAATLEADQRITYTPDAAFVGADVFTYDLSDGYATVQGEITVTVTNNAPVAAADSATTLVDQAVTVDVKANDNDGDGHALTITAVTTPSPSGTAVITVDQRVQFTPAAAFTGTATFDYTLSDGFDEATATVTVQVINTAPNAIDDMWSTKPGVATTVPVLQNDVDPDAGQSLTITTLGTPTQGSVTLVDANTKVQYTPPNAEFMGEVSFTYAATDGYLTDTATVTVLVSSTHPLAALPECQAAGYGFYKDGDDAADTCTCEQPSQHVSTEQAGAVIALGVDTASQTQSHLTNDVLTVQFTEPVKFYYPSGLNVPDVLVPHAGTQCGAAAWTWSFVANDDCTRTWTGVINWADAYDGVGNVDDTGTSGTGCGFTVDRTGNDDFIVFSLDFGVRTLEDLPELDTEGDRDATNQPTTRSIEHKLPFRILFPKQAVATSGDVVVYSPYRVIAAVSRQQVLGDPSVDGGVAALSLQGTLFTSVQWPFALEQGAYANVVKTNPGDADETETAVAKGEAGVDYSGTTGVEETTATTLGGVCDVGASCNVNAWSSGTEDSVNCPACEQTHQFTLDIADAANPLPCTFSGEWALSFVLACHASGPAVNACPLDTINTARNAVFVSFTIDSSDHCPQLIDTVDFNVRLLHTYEDASWQTVKDDFLDQQVIYFQGTFATDDVSIVSTKIVGIELLRPNQGAPAQATLYSCTFNDPDYSCSLTSRGTSLAVSNVQDGTIAEAVRAPSEPSHPSFELTVDTTYLGLGDDEREIMQFRISVDVTYQNAGQDRDSHADSPHRHAVLRRRRLLKVTTVQADHVNRRRESSALAAVGVGSATASTSSSFLGVSSSMLTLGAGGVAAVAVLVVVVAVVLSVHRRRRRHRKRLHEAKMQLELVAARSHHNHRVGKSGFGDNDNDNDDTSVVTRDEEAPQERGEQLAVAVDDDDDFLVLRPES